MKEGAFWAIGKSLDALIIGDFELLTHFVRDDSHVNIWSQIRQQRNEFSRFGYDHFPRGRIWVDNTGTAIIFINPILDLPKVIDRIKVVFDLSADVKICHDGVSPILNFYDSKKC